MLILRRKLSLSIDSASVYAHLCQTGELPHTALLETCEVGRLEHTNSFVFCSAALKICARNDDIGIRALNANGRALLASLSMDFYGYDLESSSKNDDQLKLVKKPIENVQDENKRLQQPSILSVINTLRMELASKLPQQNGNLRELIFFGAMSFDLVDQFESLPEIEKHEDDLTFYLADLYVQQNHRLHQAKIVTVQFGEQAQASAQQTIQQILAKIKSLPAPQSECSIKNGSNTQEVNELSQRVKTNIDDAKFIEHVEAAKTKIIAGDIFQVVLSRRFNLPCDDAFASYRALRISNPSPYLYFVNFGETQLFGASPESALKVSTAKEVTLYPIAGTRPRGENAESDARIEFELIQDEKESAEHMMLVDLARNDIARIAKLNSRRVSQLKNVVKYSQVMHIVSEVSAKLRSDLDSLSAYRACSNMGTLTGAPKIAAMKIIRKREREQRGLYGGAVCVYFGDDSFDSAIIIRSAVVKNNQASVTAGAGIVHDSDPQAEADETRQKASAVLKAILQANAKELNHD